jgi:CheY-like chemotaxis protein
MTKTAHVLVADDDGSVRRSTIEILSASGHVVTEARDGIEALAKLRAQEVDAVVLDVKMPGKDGISVIDEMVPGPPPPGVLLVSAFEIDLQTRRRLESKVHRVLRKPVPPPTLILAVSQAIVAARDARAP